MRDIRRRLGRNLVAPHTHHSGDVPGALTLRDLGAALVPFDVQISTAAAASYNGGTFATIPGLSQTLILPPLNTPANKWRVNLRFDAALEAETLIIGEAQLFQDGVGVGPLVQWGDDIGGSTGYYWPVSLFATLEVAPGTYTWDVRWRLATGAGDISVLSNQNQLTIAVDRLVVD